MRLRDTAAGPKIRLADDDRGRVPFALLGVLLLVGSVTWTVALAQRGPPQIDTDADAALDRGESVVHTELRQAVARAGANAAREPVVERSGTPFGRALSADAPYRDAFRVRAYRQAAVALWGVDASVGDVSVAAELPPIEDAASMRDAIERVRVSEPGDGVVRVAFENVTLTASANGRRIDRSERTVTVTVATPALSLHERAERFQGQLDEGALDGPGFGRRIAARLYAVAWTRGYAQYAGAPIENVVANRYVELSANSALLQTQRATIGVSDPAGREAAGRATARLGARELLDGAGYDGERWVDGLLGEHPAPVDGGGPIAEAAAEHRAADRGEETTVGVNRSADTALYRLSSGRNGDSLDAVVDEVYETDAKRIVETELIDDGGRVDPPGTGPYWTKLDSSAEVASVTVSQSGGPTPDLPSGWDEYAAHAREIDRTVTASATWLHLNGSLRTTTETWTERYRVGVSVGGDPADSAFAPSGNVHRLYRPGGPAGGPNLDGVPEEAVRRLVTEAGGPDAVAKAAVEDGLGDETITVDRSPPEDVSAWLYRDLVELRESTRDVTVSVDRGRIATDANPAAELESKIRDRIDAEAERRRSYDSVADKARVAARIAYLERLAATLNETATHVEETSNGFEQTVDDAGAATADQLGELVDLRNEVEPAEPRSTDAAAPAGSLRLSVDGAPPYLTLASVDRSQVAELPEGTTYHPLVAENTNVFAMPYDSNPGGVTDRVFGETGTVGLRQGARALAAAEDVDGMAAEAIEGGELAEERRALREAVASSNRVLRGTALEELRQATALDHRERVVVVDRALGRWGSTGDRALALVEGPAAEAIAREAAERDDTPDTDKFRDQLRSRLLVELSDTAESESVRLPGGVVGSTVEETQRTAKSMTEDAILRAQRNVTERAEKWIRERIAVNATDAPAGVPVTPVPGYWYATANVWQVDVAGEYASFRIDARRGTPVGRGAVDGTTSYVRDGGNVSMDLDGDSAPERLGRATRVSFSAETTVLVVVPPGKNGVGDVDGERTEQSDGWPDPGAASGD
ncbi:DUF7286 family protein [Natronoarchaeum mannanilyticum]|uniref:Uncharacterized protein n=1 Tax=Natronoarchaeum mannanilyticum TaxID=926360 RepID=A0AAV3T5H0_9EURY